MADANTPWKNEASSYCLPSGGWVRQQKVMGEPARSPGKGPVAGVLSHRGAKEQQLRSQKCFSRRLDRRMKQQLSLALVLQHPGGLRTEPGGPPTGNQQAPSLCAVTEAAWRPTVQRESWVDASSWLDEMVMRTLPVHRRRPIKLNAVWKEH